MNVKILIVDDEPGQQQLLRYNIEKSGFDVLLADNGNDALKMHAIFQYLLCVFRPVSSLVGPVSVSTYDSQFLNSEIQYSSRYCAYVPVVFRIN